MNDRDTETCLSIVRHEVKGVDILSLLQHGRNQSSKLLTNQFWTFPEFRYVPSIVLKFVQLLKNIFKV